MAAFCYLCEREVYSDGRGDYAPEKDHIVPASRVPRLEDDPPNIRWVHAWCNRVKGDRTVSEAKADIQQHFRKGTAPSCLR
jgi:5-methylcytosine-specific restriction endonuclease McrA